SSSFTSLCSLFSITCSLHTENSVSSGSGSLLCDWSAGSLSTVLDCGGGEETSPASITESGQLYLEFINLCTNIILHSVCVRRNDARNVRTVMEIICAHVQSQRDPLALTWRYHDKD
uniref:Uncharacterized protein n=1 Tax=Myripristis murdjan TaxID=586833 RepID=A0A667YR27_9TELE